MKSRIAALRSSRESWTPRRRRRLAGFPKKPLTASVQEQEVGVKWRVQRRRSASQSVTALCLWAESLSRMAWISRPAGAALSIRSRNAMNS